MKLLLVGNYQPDEQKSMNAYANLLQKGLIEEGFDVKLVCPKRLILPKNQSPTGFFKWVAYIDKFIIFPFILFFKAKSFSHTHICDHSNAMYVSWLNKQKVTITCHDVIAISAANGLIEDWKVGYIGKFFQWLILRGLLKAKKIICVSELTRKSLLELAPEAENICSVVHNALNFDYFHDENCDVKLEEMGLGYIVKKQYVLHVGSDLPRKNRPVVLEIFKNLKSKRFFENVHLVFVGPNLDRDMNQFIHNHGYSDFVHVISDITQEQLRAIYSSALLLIFPSSHEGFGWPVSEAQACGCPVFASNIDPMPEVGGCAAKYFNPLFPLQAADIIQLSDLNEMRIAGLLNVNRFKPDAMIRKVISEFQNIHLDSKQY